MARWYAGLSRNSPGIKAGRFLLSAYTAWRHNWTTPRVPHGSALIIDCGAYSAYVQGLEELPFDYTAYVVFVNNLALRYQIDGVATFDRIGDAEQSNYHAERMIDRWPSIRWIATAQGDTPADCAGNAVYLATLSPAYIGVGGITVTVQNKGVAAARERVQAVAEAVPDCELHLWGVGMRAADLLGIPGVVSADSAGWSITTGRSYTSRRQYVNERLAQYRAALDRD